MKHEPFRIRFAGAFDATGTALAPAEAVVAFDEGAWPACRLLALGPPSGQPGVVDRTKEVLLPGFVNAHTHLDLTHIGPRAYDPADGFESWLRMILAERLDDDDAIAGSVGRGVERCLAGGVVAVGDIAGTGHVCVAHAVQRSPLVGVSFVEFFGLGQKQGPTVEQMTRLVRDEPAAAAGVRLGLSPHAPYTAGLDVYRRAAAAGVPVCTHLAESLAEREFVAQASGPMRELIEGMGPLDDVAAAEIGSGRRPIEHLGALLTETPWLLAHVCDATGTEIALLARTGSSVAYCPRSSAYFGHHDALGPHRYREMLDAGVNVCLGTDSIVNLPLDESGREPTLGVLEEMRYLAARDGTKPGVLLAMATTRGARALGLDETRFTLVPGEKAGLCAVRAAEGSLDAVLGSSAPAELLGP